MGYYLAQLAYEGAKAVVAHPQKSGGHGARRYGVDRRQAEEARPEVSAAPPK